MKIPAAPPPPSDIQGQKWPQFVAVISATVAVFTTGLHTGWPAPSLPKLLSDEYPFDVSNEEASYITIIAHLGNVCGGLLGTIFLLDKIGRKNTTLLIAVPHVISFVCIVMSYQIMELLYVARFIGGVAAGMTFTTIPIYVAEIAEPSIRGTLSTMTVGNCFLGMVYVNLIGSYLSIRDTALTFLIFPAVFLLSFWRMPESPYFLLMKNKTNEAEQALKYLRRKDNVDEELAVLAKNVQRQMSESGTFKDIFTIDSNRKAFFLVIGTRVVQQFTGATAFLLYIQLLLRDATDAIPPHIGATIILIVQLLMTLLSTLFVDKWGRKPLMLFSTGGCCINLLLQAIYFGLKEHTDVDVSIIDWFPLVMMVLFTILFSGGLGVVANILSSEMFSASVKGKSFSLVNVIFALSIMATTKFYQATADSFGLMVPYLSFGVFTLLGFIFLCVYLPETKGKSLEDIQQLLKGTKKKNDVIGKL